MKLSVVVNVNADLISSIELSLEYVTNDHQVLQIYVKLF